MNDTIYRQAAIEALHKEIIERRLVNDVNDGMLDEFDTEYVLRKLPPAEPEIIRCKDCKHWKSNEFIGNNDVLTANLHSYPCKFGITDAEWYCAYAERRQDALN